VTRVNKQTIYEKFDKLLDQEINTTPRVDNRTSYQTIQVLNNNLKTAVPSLNKPYSYILDMANDDMVFYDQLIGLFPFFSYINIKPDVVALVTEFFQIKKPITLRMNIFAFTNKIFVPEVKFESKHFEADTVLIYLKTYDFLLPIERIAKSTTLA